MDIATVTAGVTGVLVPALPFWRKPARKAPKCSGSR